MRHRARVKAQRKSLKEAERRARQAAAVAATATAVNKQGKQGNEGRSGIATVKNSSTNSTRASRDSASTDRRAPDTGETTRMDVDSAPGDTARGCSDEAMVERAKGAGAKGLTGTDGGDVDKEVCVPWSCGFRTVEYVTRSSR